MNDIEYKLKNLQACIGEKKLKQLGLIPCLTCREILTQVMHVSLPFNLENKAFLSSEEMSAISQTILEATNGFLKNTSPTDTQSQPILELENSTVSNDTIDNEEFSIHSNTNSPTSNKELLLEVPESSSYLASAFQATPELINDLNSSPITNTQDLVSKLLSILNQSHHIAQDNLGIGYIYTPPAAIPLDHALSCSECGHMYAIITHPTLKLMPLPVYLSDTEYEMIKGVYVDIFL